VPTTVQEMTARPGTTTGRPRFTIGQSVAVRHGITDPDFPDQRLDGWRGTIVEVDPKHRPTRYLLRYHRGVVQQLPAECLKHCEQKDMVLDQMWLFEGDLEPLPV